MLKNELKSLAESGQKGNLSRTYRQELLRDIVLEFLREVAAQGFTKVIVEKDDIVNTILFHNQTILDEIREGGVFAEFSYGRELTINWG